MNVFSTGVLTKVVEGLPKSTPFFLNSFFRTEQLETAEEIHFDVDPGNRRLAPFVAPIVAGQVVSSRGFETKTFKPAYIKDKRIFAPGDALRRGIGEQIGGSVLPADRYKNALAKQLKDQIEMLERRLEWMAVETLLRGKITVTGELYPTVEVDFGRDPELTRVLQSSARWGEAGVDPLDDVETWARLIAQHSGAGADTLVMDFKAWKLFSASPSVQKLLDRYRGQDRLSATVSGEGAKYMGSIGDFDVWVYSSWYDSPETGARVPYLPDYTVIMTSPELDGARCFGAIRDEESGFQAMPYFPKSWVEEDPALRYLMLQSAPLMVPYRVNASLCATVR